MNERPATPAVVSADLGGVFRLYQASLSRCWPASLLLALAWGGFSTAVNRRLGPGGDLLQWIAQLQALLGSGYFWRLFAQACLLSILLYCALVARIHAVAVGAASPARADLATALRVFPGALAGAVFFLIATSVGTLLLIVPGAYLWGMWQLWLVALVVEGAGPMAALRRSWHLMAGAWWRITTLITVVGLIAVLPPMIIDAILSGWLTLAGVSLARVPAVVTIADVVMDIFLAPLIPAALVAAYLDRRRALAVHA